MFQKRAARLKQFLQSKMGSTESIIQSTNRPEEICKSSRQPMMPCARHVIFPGTPEHRNIPEHPKNPEHPKITCNTSQKTSKTSKCVCKILRIPPCIEVRNRPLMKRQKPRKVILILHSHKLENFTIFTISKIVTSASHSHILIFCGHIYMNEQMMKTEVERRNDRRSLSSALFFPLFCHKQYQLPVLPCSSG